MMTTTRKKTLAGDLLITLVIVVSIPIAGELMIQLVRLLGIVFEGVVWAWSGQTNDFLAQIIQAFSVGGFLSLMVGFYYILSRPWDKKNV